MEDGKARASLVYVFANFHREKYVDHLSCFGETKLEDDMLPTLRPQASSIKWYAGLLKLRLSSAAQV